MAEGYVRQSTFVDGDVILADDGNQEFDKLVDVFNITLGHNHDGTLGAGSSVPLLKDPTGVQDLTLTVNGITGSVVADEDDMVSDSAFKVPTQQSVKQYVTDVNQDLQDQFDAFSAVPGNHTHANKAFLDTLGSLSLPVNQAPADLATEISSTPTLTGSAFADGTTDTHLHSIWAIYSDSLGTTEVYTSGVSNDLVSHTVPEASKLSGEVQYWWGVKYVGVAGISNESVLTSFTTEVAFNSLVATTLYTGNGATQDIISGIDFTTGKGLAWVKSRDAARSHQLCDTVRGATKILVSDTTAAEVTSPSSITAFKNDGVSLGALNDVNINAGTFVAWQFKAAAGFLDIVEYTGDGIVGRTVAHALGNTFGMCEVKSLDSNDNWYIQHRSLGGTEYLVLDNSSTSVTSGLTWNDTDATNTTVTLAASSRTNGSGNRYIAYIWAHNPAKGIYCGSYVGTGAAGNKIVTGFPVGWLMVKRTDTASGWGLYDISRATGNNLDKALLADTSAAETSFHAITSLEDGFDFTSQTFNISGGTYIFRAIADPLLF